MESEYGFHIIQLIDKRGDKVNVRHILRTPKVSEEEVEATRLRLDTLANEIRDGKTQAAVLKVAQLRRRGEI